MKAIPKVIHLIWLGGGGHTPLQERCMSSWQKHAPGFEVIKWNESNCDLNENQYLSNAYAARKWAFVSDFIRFKILAEHGGIYMDTDVELHKSIEDIMKAEAFFAFERQDCVNAAIVGAVPNHPIILELMRSYENETFVNKNGRFNLAAVPMRTTKILRNHGLELNGGKQLLAHSTVVYPANILTLNAGDGELVAEHHYEASWSDKKKAKDYKAYLLWEYKKNGVLSKFRRMLKRKASEIKFSIIASSPL